MNIQRIIEFLRGIKAPSEYLVVYFHEKETTAERVCTTCTHVGTPTRQMAGRPDVERALWAILVVLAIIYLSESIILCITSFFPFRWLYKLTSMAGKVFAVLSLAYTLIRVSMRSNICPKCGSSQVIPLDTPKAQEILAARQPRG